MTKKEKVLIINRLLGIPMNVLNRSSSDEIDRFIKSRNIEGIMTEDNLALCIADKEYMKFLRSCK